MRCTVGSETPSMISPDAVMRKATHLGDEGVDNKHILVPGLGTEGGWGVGNMGEIQVKPGAGSGTFAISYLTQM